MAFPAFMFEPIATNTHRVSLRGVGFRCVGLAQKISARCKSASNTGSYVFSFFFICVFILFLAFSYMHAFLFPQRVPSDLEAGYEKSTLTRPETLFITICFKEPLLFMTFFVKRMCFYSLLEYKTRSRWLFLSRDSQNCVRDNINWEIKSNCFR